MSLWSTNYMPGFSDLKPTHDAWLRFDDDDDELAEAEANTFHCGEGFTVGWCLNDVGLVTYVGTFATEADAHKWLESEGFQDFSA